MATDNRQIQRWGVAIILTLLLLNIATLTGLWYITMSNRRPVPAPRDAMRFNQMITQRLELSDKQEQEFNQLFRTHRQMKDSLEYMLFSLSNEVLDEIFSPEPDSIRLNALADSLGSLHAEFDRLLFQHFLDIKALVRPEQLPNLEPLLREMINFSKPPRPPDHQTNEMQADPGRRIPSRQPLSNFRQDGRSQRNDRRSTPPPRPLNR